MPNTTIPTFIDQVRARILANSDLVGIGFTARSIYKRFLDTIKAQDINYPCIALATDRDERLTWGPLDTIKLYATIYMDDYGDAETAVNSLIDTLHDYRGPSSDGTVLVYYMWYMGGPPTPMWNPTRAKWEAMLRFDATVTGC